MTSLRLHHPVELRLHIEGWLLSVLLHGLVTGGAVLLVSDLRLAPQPDPFRWDVSVTATPAARTSEPSAQASVENSSAGEAQPVTEPVQTAQPLQQAAYEARNVSPSVQTEIQSTEGVAQSIRPVEVPQPIATAPPAPALPATEASQPLAAEKPVTDGTEGASAVAAVMEQASAYTPASVSSKGNYGWLAQTLWSRVEKLKRYPHIARVNRWEGRVLLRAVIADDGRLRDLTIIKSSGYRELDQEALETLERASPVPLSQPLGRPSVVVQIPISYLLH